MTKTTKEEALGKLSELRRGSATGTSKYHEAFEELEEAIETEDDAVILEKIDGDDISSTEVAGLRNYVDRHGSKAYTIRSHRIDADGERYRVVAFLDPDA